MPESPIESFSRPITPKQEARMIQQGLHDYAEDKAASAHQEIPQILPDILKPVEQAENKGAFLGRMIAEDFLRFTTDPTLNPQEYLQTVIIPRLDYATERGIILEYPKEDEDIQDKYAKSFQKADPEKGYSISEFIQPSYRWIDDYELDKGDKEKIAKQTEPLVLKALIAEKYNLPKEYTTVLADKYHNRRFNLDIDHLIERTILRRIDLNARGKTIEFDNIVGDLIDKNARDFGIDVNDYIKDEYVQDTQKYLLYKFNNFGYLRLTGLFNNSSFESFKHRVLTPEITQTSNFKENLINVTTHPNFVELSSFESLFKAYDVSPDLKSDIARDVIVRQLQTSSLTPAFLQNLMEAMPEHEQDKTTFENFLQLAPISIRNISDLFAIHSFDELDKWLNSNSEFLTFVKKDLDRELSLKREDLPNVPGFLNLLDAEQIKSGGFDFRAFAENPSYEELFNSLTQNSERWQDQTMISHLFKRGAEVFGYERMFKYLSREGLTPHDGLHAFERILDLAQKSVLSQEMVSTPGA